MKYIFIVPIEMVSCAFHKLIVGILLLHVTDGSNLYNIYINACISKRNKVGAFLIEPLLSCHSLFYVNIACFDLLLIITDKSRNSYQISSAFPFWFDSGNKINKNSLEQESY